VEIDINIRKVLRIRDLMHEVMAIEERLGEVVETGDII
jgi:hypothetical protein